MKLLLDTHIWLWSFREPHKLSPEVHKAITAPEAVRFISPISIWEVLILLEKKRVELVESFDRWFAQTTADLELVEAPLTWKVVHEMRYILPNHRDPADRFIAGTAIAYDLTLVTADETLMAVPGLKVLGNV
jgi:PIN domain nuclease of toxin-antitoxin system